MTVVNPKSISGINSITTGSGSDNLLTIHTSDANNTERLRIDSTGATKIVTGIVTTLTATTGIVTTLTANTVTSLGAVSGTTGTFTNSLTINTTTDQMLNLNSTDNGGTYIGYLRSGTRTAYLGHGGTGSTFSMRNEISNGNVTIAGNDGGSYINMLVFDTANSGNATFSGDLTVSGNLSVTGTTTQNNSVSTAQKTITLASGAANNAAVDGAGIVVDAGSDTDKTLKWLDSTDRWTFTGGDVAANSFHGDGSNLTGLNVAITAISNPTPPSVSVP